MWVSLLLATVHTVIKFSGFAAHAIIYQRVVSEVDRTIAQGNRTFPVIISHSHIDFEHSCRIHIEQYNITDIILLNMNST